MMRFRSFVILYIVIVTTPAILLFLCSMGMALEILKFSLGVIASFLMSIIGMIIGTKLGAKVTEAKPEELQREDDVLLQAVAFSQSLLFVLLSLTSSEQRQLLIYAIAIVTITFYTLRAWAKIKDSSKYRYYSMIAFAFVSSNTVISILDFYFNILRESILSSSAIYTCVALTSGIIAGKVFKKRYGYKGSLLP